MEYYNVAFINNFLKIDLANQLLSYCQHHFDKTNYRSSYLYGDEDLIYKTTYQNKTSYSYPMTWDQFDGLSHIKQQLEDFLDVHFHFCAIMVYAHEHVIIKKHRDKEMKNQPICGISLGATRRLQLTYKNLYRQVLTLTHGSLYIISALTNDYWCHEILPEEQPTDVRYSLTFRSIPDAMHVKDIKYCQAILKSGPKKGQMCNNIVYHGPYCGQHVKNC